MEAKDTVITLDYETGCKYMCNGEWNTTAMLADQAGVSFKAGIREVVEWANEYLGTSEYPPWQEQLKKWRIE